MQGKIVVVSVEVIADVSGVGTSCEAVESHRFLVDVGGDVLVIATAELVMLSVAVNDGAAEVARCCGESEAAPHQ